MQLASFPGPAQLSVACSTNKRRKAGRGLGTRLICSHDTSASMDITLTAMIDACNSSYRLHFLQAVSSNSVGDPMYTRFHSILL